MPVRMVERQGGCLHAREDAQMPRRMLECHVVWLNAREGASMLGCFTSATRPHALWIIDCGVLSWPRSVGLHLYRKLRF